MYRRVRIGDKFIYVRPYTTEIELNLLEVITFTDYKSDEDYGCIIDQVLDYCVKDYDDSISDIEKIITCLIVRDLSIGDEINIVYTCPFCGKKKSLRYLISDILMISSKTSDYIEHKFMSVDEFESYELDSSGFDDMDIDEYESVNDDVSSFFTIYNNRVNVSCDCNGASFVNIFTFKNVLRILTEESFNSLTSWIHALVDIGHHTRGDVLRMTPVQRIMELKYFKDTHKELEDA
jgi:hypothetical protein